MPAPVTLTVVEEYAARPELVSYVENMYAVVADVPTEVGMPAMDLSVVLTGDLTASIQQRGERDFQPERTGGIVTGKTIGLRRDFSQTVILLSTGPADADDFDPLEFVHLLGHEFCHAFLGRLRGAAGTRPARPTRVQTPAEAAAILAYEAADEFRCDLFSNLVLTTTLSVPVDEAADQRRPLHLGDVFEDSYRSAFAHVLDSVYPGWPDLIRSYQHHEIALDDMFGQLVKKTEAMLILVAHADAVEQAAGHRPLLTDFTHHPGAQGLLSSAWNPLRAVLDRTQLIPPLSNFADVDRALQDCGRHITDMWATLGVSGYLTEDDELCITIA